MKKIDAVKSNSLLWLSWEAGPIDPSTRGAAAPPAPASAPGARASALQQLVRFLADPLGPPDPLVCFTNIF